MRRALKKVVGIGLDVRFVSELDEFRHAVDPYPRDRRRIRPELHKLLNLLLELRALSLDETVTAHAGPHRRDARLFGDVGREVAVGARDLVLLHVDSVHERDRLFGRVGVRSPGAYVAADGKGKRHESWKDRDPEPKRNYPHLFPAPGSSAAAAVDAGGAPARSLARWGVTNWSAGKYASKASGVKGVGRAQHVE